MSWVTQKKIMTDILDSRGYNMVNVNLEPEESSMHFANKGYSIKPEMTFEDSYTNASVTGIEAILKISYEAVDVSIYDEMFDEFIDLVNTLGQSFQLSNNQPTFERVESDSLFINAEVRFWISMSIC